MIKGLAQQAGSDVVRTLRRLFTATADSQSAGHDVSFWPEAALNV